MPGEANRRCLEVQRQQDPASVPARAAGGSWTEWSSTGWSWRFTTPEVMSADTSRSAVSDSSKPRHPRESKPTARRSTVVTVAPERQAQVMLSS